MRTTYTDASRALPQLLERVLSQGIETSSRNGRTKELLMQQVILQQPDQVAITTPGRAASLPAQIAETMWLLAGRDDIAWLSHYLPRAADFSDDGKVWRGAYGPRIRAWKTCPYAKPLDQLAHVIDLLKADPDTRRAVISIYGPDQDAKPGKDIPCNDFLQFVQRDGELHAHVFIRSNDLMWGWSGINAFEWTSLLTIVAGLTGFRRGSITFSITSLHLYERHWDKARRIVAAHHESASRRLFDKPFRPSPVFSPGLEGLVAGAPVTLEQFDALVGKWFEVEELIRTTSVNHYNTMRRVNEFPEPMLQSWLQVLYAWHHGEPELASSLKGTALYKALELSPAKAKQTTPPPEPEPSLQAFTEFVADLHAEKHAAYGDSWFKRGEQISIMANIARKVDRLGVAGGGDTSADTAIDLLVYLVKYRMFRTLPVDRLRGEHHVPDVTLALQTLQSLSQPKVTTTEVLISTIKELFDDLEDDVKASSSRADQRISDLIAYTYPLAVRLWRAEQVPTHAERNASRAFTGYATTEDQP